MPRKTYPSGLEMLSELQVCHLHAAALVRAIATLIPKADSVVMIAAVGSVTAAVVGDVRQ
jgi:hypothetical protein